MRYFVILVSVMTPIISFAYASPDAVQIRPIPIVLKASPALIKSFIALKRHVESDARHCLENARGMGVAGTYNSSVRKSLDTSKVIVLEVSVHMICDGVHSSSYKYGEAFEKATGRRFDLNRIYNIGVGQRDRLFLRQELDASARASYRQANKDNQSCLGKMDSGEELTSIPITFSPLADGSVVLYYAAPEVSEACFPALRLPPDEISEFRNGKLASRYELP